MDEGETGREKNGYSARECTLSIVYYIVCGLESFLFSYLFLISHWNENINRSETFDFVAPVWVVYLWKYFSDPHPPIWNKSNYEITRNNKINEKYFISPLCNKQTQSSIDENE